MEVEYRQQSNFDMSDALESINNGISRFNKSQIFPISGNVTGTVGTGTASGSTIFQFNETSEWWLPSQSYFHMKLTFTGAGSTINNAQYPGTANALVTYCDNFICTLFTQIQSQINSQPLDTVTTPWIVDTALGYSKAHWNFIKSYSSMTRMGEGLATRLLNVSQNSGVIEVAFRPPLSLFDVKILPPGAQFRFTFLWAATAKAAFEALQKDITWGTSANQNSVSINSFSFYKASVLPAPGIMLPKQGVVDLCPAVANQYPFPSNGTSMQAQISLPGTTNRILVVFQDTSTVATFTDIAPVDRIGGVNGGYNPATSFSSLFIKAVPSGAGTTTYANDTVKLSNLWISLPELGITTPSPQYTFGTDNTDMIRAYSDWAHLCQGTASNYEGSLPYGNADPTLGTQIISLDDNTAQTFLLQPGDNNNYQQYNAWYVGNTNLTAKAYNQTSLWGWSGSRPGPIFAFPVVRPEYKQVSQGILYVNLTGAPYSVTATVIATYSMALAVEDVGNGLYEYKLITGV